MYHFFVTPKQVEDGAIRIEGADVNHIKNVLRMEAGEKLEVSDGNNNKYLCAIQSFEAESIRLSILEELISDRELPSKITLFQGLPKGDKMELIIQKAVELGAYEIVPVATRRAVVKLDEKKALKKVERWNGIAESAAKQSGRDIVPKVKPVMDFKKAVDLGADMDVLLIPYELAEGMEETKQIISRICPGQTVGVFIGPEGGFEKEEVEYALHKGGLAITLGKRILRTETAGLTALSILMYHLESDSHKL